MAGGKGGKFEREEREGEGWGGDDTVGLLQHALDGAGAAAAGHGDVEVVVVGGGFGGGHCLAFGCGGGWRRSGGEYSRNNSDSRLGMEEVVT